MPGLPCSPMSAPSFDAKGQDRTTFAPFKLQNCLATEWADVRLSFDDWGFLHGLMGTDTVDGYYLNGYGVEGLVRAALLAAGGDPDGDEMHGNSEGDTCYLHFTSLESAVAAATAAAAMMKSRERVAELIKIAREHGFED